MSHRVCPWWLGYMLVSPLRRLWQHPVKTLQPFVGPGMVVLEPGCGMGYFTLDLARMTGPDGRVVAVDLQPKMLDGLRRRARRAGLLDRIDVRLAEPTRLGLNDLVGRVDVALALHVVHELPNAASFFAEVRELLRPDGGLLVVEPRGHVSESDFETALSVALRAGFEIVRRPLFGRDRAAWLRPSGEASAA